ncbi:ankyrin repeat domain-containing protein [Endozoicomonas sp. ALC020]|uniref:ankyrin repeat domain-containing protein n=1 Tax=unclassified Endozoicomonas TaxID=2644528 RepID=UPI003BAF6004
MPEVKRLWSSQPNVVDTASIWTVFQSLLLVSPSARDGVRCAARTTDGATPLFIAAWRGCTDCVEILIHVGADLNAATTSGGATPLFVAAEKGNTECLKALIEAEADLSVARTLDGTTPLSIAAIATA